ncbi:MAG: hypothetical protein O3A00_10115 [Planctomycetota bacterium]|nr:hypothetical protein [Planctomycetota bacterium]
MNRVFRALAASAGLLVMGCAIQVDIQRAQSLSDLAPRVSLFSASRDRMLTQAPRPTESGQAAIQRYGLTPDEARQRLEIARSRDSRSSAKAPDKLAVKSAKPIRDAEPIENRFQLTSSKLQPGTDGHSKTVDPLKSDHRLFDDDPNGAEASESNVEPSEPRLLPDFKTSAKPLNDANNSTEFNSTEFNPFVDLPTSKSIQQSPQPRVTVENPFDQKPEAGEPNDQGEKALSLFDGPNSDQSEGATAKNAIAEIQQSMANLKSERLNQSVPVDAATPNKFVATSDAGPLGASLSKGTVKQTGHVASTTDMVDAESLHAVRCRVRIRRTDKSPATNVTVGMSLPTSMRFDAASGPSKVSLRKNEIEFAAISKLDFDAEVSFDVTMSLPSAKDIGLKVRIKDDQQDRSGNAWSISIERLATATNANLPTRP